MLAPLLSPRVASVAMITWSAANDPGFHHAPPLTLPTLIVNVLLTIFRLFPRPDTGAPVHDALGGGPVFARVPESSSAGGGTAMPLGTVAVNALDPLYGKLTGPLPDPARL